MIRTIFARRRINIPDDVRTHNRKAIHTAMVLAKPHIVVGTFAGEISASQAVYDNLRELKALWDRCETTFAAFDVHAADPVQDAYDRAAFNGGRYPKAPRGTRSLIGSASAMCADAGW